METFDLDLDEDTINKLITTYAETRLGAAARETFARVCEVRSLRDALWESILNQMVEDILKEEIEKRTAK